MMRLPIKKTSHYLLSMGVVFLMSCVGLMIHKHFEPTNLVMLYLLAVVISASLWGRGPAIATSLISVLVFDVLFIPPRFKFSVADTQYILTFIGLFVVGVMISELASKLRERALEASRREAQTAILYRLSRDLTTTLNLTDVLDIIRAHVEKVTGSKVKIYLQQAGALKQWVSGAWASLEEFDESIARWVVENVSPAGAGTSHIPSANACYLPLKTGNQTVGVLSYRIRELRDVMERDESVLLDALANQCALAIERIRLLEENRNMELLRERDKLYTVLLNSISHDLRTPLVAITGTLSSLMEDGEHLERTTVRELIETAFEESLRLNNIVGDLLDITRIEAGALRATLQPCDVRDIISVSLDHVREKMGTRPVQVDIVGEIPEVVCDMSLIVKALAYVLDNAIKYSPADAPISVTARAAETGVNIIIRDYGKGIPTAEMEHIFRKFFRGEHSYNVPGLGLGLSICKGIIEVHKGTIRIESDREQGTTVTITLPETS